MPRRRLGMTLLLGLLATLPVARVAAWGAQGHHVVARIAWARMSEPARARASALLGGGADVFVASATWADDIRPSRPETANWHYVDIPATATAYDAARDCAPHPGGDCLVAAIERARAELADKRRPDAEATESLKFLIHFVGDVHQPLHDIDDHDRGGNDVHVTALRGEAGRPTTLHAAWDTGLINLSDETEAARATRLLAALATRPPDLAPNVIRWAEAGHQLALEVAYAYPAFSVSGPPAEPVTLGADYRTKALEVIDGQLALAGARLAALLNGLLAN